MGQEEQDQRIDYVEFAVADIARARSFFEKAFGRQFTDYGPQYTAFSDGRLSGGFREAAETSGGGPLVVLYVTDLKAAQERIVASGGKIVVDTFEFPGGSRFHFTDPNGVELAVWSEG